MLRHLVSVINKMTERGVMSDLVRTGGYLEFPRIFVVSQPAPARALDSHSGGAQFGLHGIKATKVSGTKFGQGSGGFP